MRIAPIRSFIHVRACPGHATWMLEYKADLYKYRRINNPRTVQPMHLIFIYWWLEWSQSRDSGECTRVRATPTDVGSRCTFPFAPFSRLCDSKRQPESRQEPRNRREQLRDETAEGTGRIGVRAEVTPAPRRSRSRAPVRSDAFYRAFLFLAALCLRYVISSIRFSLTPVDPPY